MLNNNILNESNFEPMKDGSMGELVELLQNELKVLGLFSCNVNGIYDICTEDGVRKFQSVTKLPASGIVDYN